MILDPIPDSVLLAAFVGAVFATCGWLDWRVERRLRREREEQP